MAAGRIKGITIEINGDATKLTKALSSVDHAISTTQKNIRDLEKALKLDPGNTALLKDKQKELSVEIENTEAKIKAEKEALEQMKDTEGFDASSEKARNLQTQIDLDTASLKQLKKEAFDCASVIGTQMQLAGQKVQEVGQKISGVGDKIAQVGQDLTTKVTVPIVTGFAAAIKTTADFDEQMSKVKAISGATAEEFDELRAKAREMGAQTKFSAAESGQAFEYMAMAGWKTEDMLDGIEGIMNLAAASGEELGTVSDIVTDALTAFGMSAKDSGRFADILAAAATNANTNVGMMGESFKYVAPVAGSLGYSAEDVAVALGLMANNGIKADMAGTSLRNMFQRMAKPTKESQAAMDRLGLSLADDSGRMYSFREIMQQLRESFVDINMPLEEYNKQLDELDAELEKGTIKQSQYDKELEELNKQAFGAEGAEKARAAAMLGGTRAMSGLLAIANATTEDFNALTAAIDGSSGAAESMANTMLDNLNGQLTILKSQLAELAISFGDLLMPLLREVVGKLQGVVDWLNSLDDAQREQIIKIAAIAAAVGPVLLIIGKVVGAIGMIVSAIGTVISVVGTIISAVAGVVAALNPVTLVIMAIIAACVALGVAVATHWEQVKEWFGKFIEWIQPVVDSVKEFGQAILEFIQTFIQFASGYIKKFIDDHQREINMLITTVKTIIDTGLSVIKEIITRVLENIKIVFKTVIDVITNLIKAGTAIMKGDWSGALDALKNAASSAWNGIKAIFNNMKDGLSNIMNTLIDNFKNWGRDMIDSLIGGIKDKIASVRQAAEDIAGAIAEFIHFSEPDRGPLKDTAKFMPDMIKLLSATMENSLPALEAATEQMAAAMAPGANTLQGGNQTSIQAPVNITVYGAQGQDVNELADVIQQRINNAVYRNGAVFA